jgi:hypothetical protein
LAICFSERFGERVVMYRNIFAIAMLPALGWAEQTLEFNRDIRPILSENCFYCHGQDPKQRKGDLRLDDRQAAVDALAIVPGSPEKSEMIVRLEAKDPEEHMPPPDSHREVKPEQVEKLKRWIAEGAAYERHWSFNPPKQAPLPAVAEPKWTRQPWDAFVFEKLAHQQLRPAPEATPREWLRRVHFDLHGLPPSAEQVKAFTAAVAAEGEAAYEKKVDELLANTAYGERLAIDWLDAARYADTHGFNNDSARSMWRWRDWVIDAFNSNLPYNEFITQQLAGDLLPQPTVEQQLATGYCRNHVINSEGGIIEEEYRVEYVADRVRTMSLAWMGLTMECARCHDHKYDPITTKNYYELFAFFNNVSELGEDGRVANAAPLIPAPTREQQGALAKLQRAQIQLQQARQAEKPLPIDTQAVEAALREIAGRLPKPFRAFDAENSTPIKGQLAFPKGNPAQVSGVVNQAWSSDGKFPLAEIPLADEMKPAAKKPTTLTFFIQPAADNPADVALLSTQGYGGSRAGASYRHGIELRLIDGRLEYTIASHYPSYALRVLTKDAVVKNGEWHAVTLLQDGGERAASTRIFVDGREQALTVLNDGLSGYFNTAAYWVGADQRKEESVVHFKGALDELAFYNRLLDAGEILDLTHAGLWKLALATDANAAPLQQAAQWLQNPVWAALYEKEQQVWQDQLKLERQFPTAMVMAENAPRQAHVLTRGAYDALGEPVSAGVPEQLLGAWPVGAPRNRLGLAQWLTQPSQPLTARVVVNRFWAQFFGTGIVKTLEDLGFQSEWPSHPELLDYLARDFMDHGWNVKALLKSFALSATYRQSSSVTSELQQRDPENRLLARGPRLRLPAELIRDQALAVSGLLTRQVGGPSVYPYQPTDLYKGIVVGADYPGTTWTQSMGADLYRRSLYTFWKRTVPHPNMLTFDAPDREFCAVRRSRTNTPLQALALQNDPTYLEAARVLAENVLQAAGPEPAQRCQQALTAVLGREASPVELKTLLHTYDELFAQFSKDEAAAQEFLKSGAKPANTAYKPAELATMASIAGLLLNLDETISKP